MHNAERTNLRQNVSLCEWEWERESTSEYMVWNGVHICHWQRLSALWRCVFKQSASCSNKNFASFRNPHVDKKHLVHAIKWKQTNMPAMLVLIFYFFSYGFFRISIASMRLRPSNLWRHFSRKKWARRREMEAHTEIKRKKEKNRINSFYGNRNSSCTGIPSCRNYILLSSLHFSPALSLPLSFSEARDATFIFHKSMNKTISRLFLFLSMFCILVFCHVNCMRFLLLTWFTVRARPTFTRYLVMRYSVCAPIDVTLFHLQK